MRNEGLVAIHRKTIPRREWAREPLSTLAFLQSQLSQDDTLNGFD
jgi:hypothetical protein